MRLQSVLTAVLLVLSVDLAAWACQPTCVLSFHLRNSDRHVHDDFLVSECPGDPPHSPPFGNWGVLSPGEGQTPKNRDQFQGWKDFLFETDNQWNSCTARQDLYPEGNCSFYNHDGCTAQITDRGTNRYTNHVRQVSLPVSCPFLGLGGCQDLDGMFLDLPGEFLDLFELDAFQNWASDPDAFVDELLPPLLSVFVFCPEPEFCVGSTGFPTFAVSLFGADISAIVWIELLGGGYVDSPQCPGGGIDVPLF
ncbi:MAG: hypothetical protein ACE5G6_01790 [Terriglobia bacterium]